MTDYHVITTEAAELIMQVLDGQIVIVSPAEPEQPATDKVPAAPDTCPCG